MTAYPGLGVAVVTREQLAALLYDAQQPAIDVMPEEIVDA